MAWLLLIVLKFFLKVVLVYSYIPNWGHNPGHLPHRPKWWGAKQFGHSDHSIHTLVWLATCSSYICAKIHMGHNVLEGYSLKNLSLFFKVWTLSTQQLSPLGDQTYFPGLSFNLWHLGRFHLEPYQSSEGPHFGGPGALWLWKLWTWNWPTLGGKSFWKWGVSEDW